jgi:hypothetical protein
LSEYSYKRLFKVDPILGVVWRLSHLRAAEERAERAHVLGEEHLHFSPAYKSKVGIATQVGFSCFLVARRGALCDIYQFVPEMHTSCSQRESTQGDTRGKYVRVTDTG